MRFQRFLFVVAAVWLTARCASFQLVMDPAHSRGPASLPMVAPDAPSDLFAVKSQPTFNFGCTELDDLLKKKQPSTVEELLRGIQDERPQYLTRTVFNYETRMPFDAASFLHPRAIVYGGDAKTILAFGGLEKRRGYDRLEVICFDDHDKKFNFEDIAFPKESVGILDGPGDLTNAEKLEKYVVIPGGRGKRTCANCHQGRPNWDTSDFWPGFYGASNDSLKDPNRPEMRSIYATVEHAYWTRFEGISAKKDRYRYVSQPLIHPNADFTLKLSYLNGQRIIGDLERLGPAFQSRKYEFAKALFCTPRAEQRTFYQLSGDSSIKTTVGVLPENSGYETKDIFLSSYYDQYQKEGRLRAILGAEGYTSPLPREYFEELRYYYRRILNDRDLNLDMKLSAVDVDEVLTLKELKHFFERYDLGVDIENWSMVSEGGYVHENGMGGKGKVALRLILERPFVDGFLKDNPELQALIQGRENKEREYYLKDDADNSDLLAEIDRSNHEICTQIESRLKR